MSESISATSAVKSKQDLPPDRDRKGIRSVSPPLSHTSFRQFNRYLAIAGALLLAFYGWRLAVMKAEAGSWWNLVLGKQPPAFRDGNASGASVTFATPAPGAKMDSSVEDRINELASVLGMPSKDLASAIAAAVHEYVPPATLSSIASSQTGEAVQFIVDPSGAADAQYEATAVAPAASKGFNAAAKAFDAVVGMDEPPSDLS